ncbi:unnamed protein product, partial [Hapterophycus canaliculatus]
PELLLLVLTGTAWTGKTVIINEMIHLVGANRFTLMAPTGCAAYGIGGQTLHSDLKIPKEKRGASNADESALSTRALADLQQRFTGVDYILVDEMLTIGQDLMSIRGRQAVQGQTRDGTGDRHLGLFGKLNLILVGDSMQLPPVGAALMWPGTTCTQAGVVQGGAPRRGRWVCHEGAFRPLQDHRMRSQLPDNELARFLDAVHRFPTNAMVDDQNLRRLATLGSLIVPVKAKHTGRHANVSANHFRSLAPHHYLAVIARVFINNKVGTSAGLANIAAGERVHASW